MRLPSFLRVPHALAIAAALASVPAAHAIEPWIHPQAAAGDFPLATASATAPIVYSESDATVVSIAAHDLAADIERVSGHAAEVRGVPAGTDPVAARPARTAVLIGTLGQSELIDALVAARTLDVGDLRGKWESFVIATVAHPTSSLDHALVIVGSDRRGTAYGVYELSRAIGVSPWHWWADVTPARQDALYVAAGTRRMGPPSVKYRGIFLNDEDWGLQPWAAKTLEPEHGGIGPKTYTKLFELLLRLKANTLWPAMHPTTKPFNDFPENKQIADRYAIVMGSSHAEPMLRDNVGEWKQPAAQYNYVTNRAGVLAYWEERMRENGRYENIYTIGMRGVHDSGIQGAKTDAQRIQILEQVFADQRALIAKYAGGARPPGGLLPSDQNATMSALGTPGSAPEPAVRPVDGARMAEVDVTRVPQMFCAYKEVLGLYRQGLKVPDDVTIVWPDDNFGYVRNFATPEEQKRSGGFGVYYHLSYLGAPMAYLWLYTTPPALVWEEMTKAYAYGARNIWIANVGDLKPAEIGTEFFLRLAWDVDAWRADNVSTYLNEWAAREFGAAHAAEVAAIMEEYYRLNFPRRPEHLQWWLPKQSPHPSPLTRAEIEARLAAFAALRARADAVLVALPAGKRDAYFELVAYPVRGSALANERYFDGELAAFAPAGSDERTALAARATSADAALVAETRTYNEQIAGGKWNGIMQLEPADEQWKSFRLEKWRLPAFTAGEKKPDAPGGVAIEAERFSSSHPGAGASWQVIRGLGRTGDSVAVFPTRMDPITPEQAGQAAPRLDYAITTPAGSFPLTFHLLPTYSIRADEGLRFAIALDDDAPQPVVLKVRDGSAEWAQGVLNQTVTITVPLEAKSAGPHTLHVYGTDPGVVLDQIVIGGR